MRSSVTISGAQRQVLYELLRNRLVAIGDVNLAVEGGEYATAARLASEFAAELRLLADLGWDEAWRDEAELTMPYAELAPLLYRLRCEAEGALAGNVEEREAQRAEEAARCRYRYAKETCTGLLLLLDELEAGK